MRLSRFRTYEGSAAEKILDKAVDGGE